MSVAGMQEAWNRLAEELDEFYAEIAGALLEGQSLSHDQFDGLEPATDRLLELSATIRVQALEELKLGDDEGEQASEQHLGAAGEAQYDQVCEFLLAAATVDAVVASDLSRLDPDAQLDRGASKAPQSEVPRLAEIFDRWSEEARERRSAAALFREGQEAIAQADALYRAPPLLAGGSPFARDSEALIGDVHDTVIDLVQLAETPAAYFFEGFTKAATLGVGNALDHAELMDVVRHLPSRVEPLVRGAGKFLREHVRKVVALAIEESILDEAADLLSRRLSVRSLLEQISASDTAIELSRVWIDGASALDREATDGLRSDLDYLRVRYRKHMKWLRTSARMLRFSAKPLALVASHLGPPGWLIMPGVFTLGGGYVAYSLTDRLDVRDLGFADRITGVKRLVEARIPH